MATDSLHGATTNYIANKLQLHSVIVVD